MHLNFPDVKFLHTKLKKNNILTVPLPHRHMLLNFYQAFCSPSSPFITVSLQPVQIL